MSLLSCIVFLADSLEPGRGNTVSYKLYDISALKIYIRPFG